MSDFITYIKQRFHLGIFSLLVLFLLLFSKSKLVFGLEDVLNFVLLLFFLMIMRLYDDLQNSVTDREKKNRIYTESEARKKLYVALIILILSFLILIFNFKKELLWEIILFFCINHILYLFLFNYRNFRSYLPLLKYPLIFIALYGQFNIVSIALFLAMIVFEILDDIKFPTPEKYSYAIISLTMILLIPNFQIKYLLTLLIILPITFFIISKNSKTTPYLFLLIFLITRLTIISYEI